MAARIARGLGLLDPPDPSAEESAQWGIAPPPPPPGAGPAPESTPPSPATLATASGSAAANGSPLSAITQADVDKINRAREAKGGEPIDLGDLAQASSSAGPVASTAAPLTGSVVMPTSMIGNRPASATSTGEITNDQGQPIAGPEKPAPWSVGKALTYAAESPLRGLATVENASRIPKVTPALEKTGEFLGEAARPVGEAFGSLVQPSAPGQAPSQAQVVGGNVAKAVVKGSVPTTGLDIALAAAPFAGDVADAARGVAAGARDVAGRALEGTAPTLEGVVSPVGEVPKPRMGFPHEVATGEPGMVAGGSVSEDPNLRSVDEAMAFTRHDVEMMSDGVLRENYRKALDEADNFAAIKERDPRRAAEFSDVGAASMRDVVRYGEELARRTGGREGLPASGFLAGGADVPENAASGGSAAPPPPSPPAGDVAAPPPAGTPPPGPADTSPAATTLHDLFGVETPVPQLTRWQQALNSLNRITGRPPDEPIAAGAFKVLREGRQNIDAQANRFGAVASQIVKEGGFDLDASGRITNLPGNPTIQDLAARLPEFEGSLTPAQLQAMRDLQAETKPFADALTQQLQDSEARSRYDKPFAELTPEQQATVAKNAAIASRADVQDGGFYLPRGRADLEGADAASGGGRGGGLGGKKGFERTATFESMGQGIDQGFKYSPFGDSMQAYARDAGNRTLDNYISDYFKNVTDENGNKLAQTAADRVNPGLRDRVQALRGQIAGKLDTLARQEARGGAQDAAQRRLEGLLKGIEGQVQRKLDQIDATGATYGHTDEAVIRAEAELGALDKMANRVAGAVNTAADAGKATAGRANATDAALTKLRSDFNDISGDWAMAKKKAMQTPRGQGTIHDFSGLQGYSFPDEVSNAANKYIDQMKPPSGSGAFLPRTIGAVNNLLRGLRASTDISFTGIQGLLGLGHDPGAYGQALKVATQSLADKDALGAFFRDFDKEAAAKGLPNSREWAAAGLHFGGRETEFSIGQGLGGIGERIGSLPVVKQSNRSFGYFGDTLRPAMAQDMFENPGLFGSLLDAAFPRVDGTATARAASSLTGAERTAAMRQIADASNLLTGWSRGRFLGDFGQLAQFAPRFFQSQLELVAKAATDGSMTGDQARKALLKLAGYGTLITVGANEALGNDKDHGFDYLTPLKNGSLNSNFMRIRVPGGPTGGRDVSLFGPWDSLLRGVVAAGGGDPGYLARTKASPTIGTAIDLITGKDFTGKDVGGAKVAGISTGSPDYWLHNLLPFSISGQGNQSPLADPAGTALGATGLKVSPESFTEQRDQLARQTFNGKGYDQLDYGQRKQVDDKAKTQGIASSQPPSQLQVQGDAAKQTFASQDTDTANAFKAGTLNQRLADALHDTSMQRLGSSTLQNGYYDAAGISPQSDFAKRFSTLMDGYQAQVVKDTNNQIDWQTTKAGQAKFVAGLPNTPGKDGAPSDRQLFQSYLDYAEANKSPLQQQVDTYNQAREAAGYYEPKADTAALDKAHPDLDVQGWYLGGGYQTRDGPFAPSLQTVGAVDKALQMVTDQGLANRPVKLAGLPRPVNENDGTQAAFKATEKLIDTYQNKVVPQNAEKVAQQLYGHSFASLKPTGPQSQESVVNEIHRQVMLGTPQLDAAMAWFGASDSLGSSAALAAYKDMIKKYGPGYSAPKFQLHLAAGAQ